MSYPPFVITTIQLALETRSRLAALRSSPRETYDEILNKLLRLVPEGDEEGLYSETFRVGLLNARLDLREGRVVDHSRLRRQLRL